MLATGPISSAYAPFVPGSDGGLQSDMTLSIDRNRIDDRRRLLTQLDGVKRDLDAADGMGAMDSIRAQAFDVLLHGAAEAFDLSRESPRTIERYDTAGLVRPESIYMGFDSSKYYVDHGKTLGKLLLLARRLCEAGCGFVLVNTGFVWDMHGVAQVHAGMEEGMRYVGPPFDHAVSAFLDDVEERGLSDKILLVMCGEMGARRNCRKTPAATIGETSARWPWPAADCRWDRSSAVRRPTAASRPTAPSRCTTSSARSCTRCSTPPSCANGPNRPLMWPRSSPIANRSAN